MPERGVIFDPRSARFIEDTVHRVRAMMAGERLLRRREPRTKGTLAPDTTVVPTDLGIVIEVGSGTNTFEAYTDECDLAKTFYRLCDPALTTCHRVFLAPDEVDPTKVCMTTKAGTECATEEVKAVLLGGTCPVQVGDPVLLAKVADEGASVAIPWPRASVEDIRLDIPRRRLQQMVCGTWIDVHPLAKCEDLVSPGELP